MELAKVIANTDRLRLIQHLSLHEQAAASEIRKEMPDIPQTTLYRHLKLLEESGLIGVVRENRIRGTVEKVYALNISGLNELPPKETIDMMLLSLISDFGRYFSDEKADPMGDILFLRTAMFYLTDKEFGDMLAEIGAVMAKRLEYKQGKGRKLRALTTISSPVGGKTTAADRLAQRPEGLQKKSD
jgi:DNA-binding PadR family transcriptional regulator